MSDEIELCTTCGPNWLKFSRHNGRGRVEVPEDFLADKLGSIDQQIAEGMAMAERLAAARQKRAAAPATRRSQSYQPQEPSAPTHTAGNFTFDALTMTAETQQGAPSGESQRPRGNQFTLAETEHASLLGIGPPPGPPTTTQFNIAESGAAHVFPALIQQQAMAQDQNDRKFNTASKTKVPGPQVGSADRESVENLIETGGPGKTSLTPPKKNPKRRSCPSKFRHSFEADWREMTTMGSESSEDDAKKAAAAAAAAIDVDAELDASTKPGVLEDKIEALLASAEADGGYSWKCDDDCKLKVTLVGYHYSLIVEGIAHETDGEWVIWVVYYRSLLAVIDIECVTK